MISSTFLRRLACGFAAVTVVTLIGGSTPGQRRRSTTHAAICGNPRILCQTIATFQPNDLPFRVPKNAVKVFGSRCTDPENLFYLDLSSRQTRNLSETHRIMAVYAGTTKAEAQKMLAGVKATGKFPGANTRRMRTGFNGT